MIPLSLFLFTAESKWKWKETTTHCSAWTIRWCSALPSKTWRLLSWRFVCFTCPFHLFSTKKYTTLMIIGCFSFIFSFLGGGRRFTLSLYVLLFSISLLQIIQDVQLPYSLHIPFAILYVTGVSNQRAQLLRGQICWGAELNQPGRTESHAGNDVHLQAAPHHSVCVRVVGR